MSKKTILAATVSFLVAAVVMAALVVLMNAKDADRPLPAPVVPSEPARPVPSAPPPPPVPFTDKGRTDLIMVTSPLAGQTVGSPLLIEGEARGNWYFEATFPIKLLDGNGNVIAQHYAQAEGEWMTTEFVPFRGTLIFDAPTTVQGTLLLERSNASGLPEHDDAIRIPVVFERSAAMPVSGCVRTGCSGQVCAEREVMSTCEFRPEYACYRSATCERQPDGYCGWTPTPALGECLAGSSQ